MKYILFLLFILVPAFTSAQTPKQTVDSSHQLPDNIKKQIEQLNSLYKKRLDIDSSVVSMLQQSKELSRRSLSKIINARAKAVGLTLTSEMLQDSFRFHAYEKMQDDLSDATWNLLKIIEKKDKLKESFSIFLSLIEAQENRIRVEQSRYNEIISAEVISTISVSPEYQMFHLKPQKAEMLSFEKKKDESLQDEFIEVTEEPKPQQNIQAIVIYPRKAIKTGIQGKVTYSALIDTNGNVTKVHIDKSDNVIFDQAVIDAVKNTKFKPALNGDHKPVRVWYTQSVNFKIKPTEDEQDYH